jgi:hypothetical protein
MAKRFSEYRRRDRLSWANVDSEIVLAVAGVCDGHTIFKPEAFIETGAPPALIAQHTKCYESNPSDPKETIFDEDGDPMNQCLGVYGLQMIQVMCSDLGVDYEAKMGRGFQAAACRAAIIKHFAAKEVSNG